MQLFYFQDVTGKSASLYGDEAKHCYRVLRKKRGDIIFGVDGKGSFIEGRITDLKKNEVVLDILKREAEWGERTDQITVAISLLRLENRFEWVVEKAVELGATKIIPLICKHSIKKKMKRERLTKIMVSALKQCKRSRLPELVDPVLFHDFVSSPVEGIKVMGYCQSDGALKSIEKKYNQDPIILLVGPEGGFSPEEVSMAKEKEFQIVSLGHNRLRAETAAIFLMSWAKYLTINQ